MEIKVPSPLLFWAPRITVAKILTLLDWKLKCLSWPSSAILVPLGYCPVRKFSWSWPLLSLWRRSPYMWSLLTGLFYSEHKITRRWGFINIPARWWKWFSNYKSRGSAEVLPCLCYFPAFFTAHVSTSLVKAIFTVWESYNFSILMEKWGSLPKKSTIMCPQLVEQI